MRRRWRRGAGDEGSDEQGNPPVALAVAEAPSGLPSCTTGDTTPCGTFVTRTGRELPLGKYGAVMERNVGRGFQNRVNFLDSNAGCRLFGGLFGGDAAEPPKS